MNDLTTIDLSRFGKAAPFIRPAAEAVAEAESTIADQVWLAGQKLQFLSDNCEHGQWAEICQLMGIKERRALDYRHVYNAWKDRRSHLPNIDKEALFTISRPSATETARNVVCEMAANGKAPTVDETEEIVRSKPSTPTEFDDSDRTRQEPEDGGLTPKQVVRLLTAILRAAQKAKDNGVPWGLVREQLQLIAGEAGDNLVGLDEATIRGLLR